MDEDCCSDNCCSDWAYKIHILLLGLVMLVPGLMKLLVMKPANVAGFLGSLGIPAPNVLVWVLIASEIGSGAAILASFVLKGVPLKYVAWLPVVVLVVAAATALKPYGQNSSNILLHLIAASDFALLALWNCGTEPAPKAPMAKLAVKGAKK